MAMVTTRKREPWHWRRFAGGLGMGLYWGTIALLLGLVSRLGWLMVGGL